MSDYIIVGLVAAFAAAIHRAAILWMYRSWFRQGFAGDAAFHLAVIRQIKRTGSFAGVEDFLIIDEPDAYPILFHRIGALFPAMLIERHPYVVNAALWVALNVGSAAYVQYVSAQLLHFPGFVTALAFLGLFLGLASNLSLDMNGLNYISLSERMLARYACAFFFLAISIAMNFGDGISYLMAFVAGTIALMTSFFSRQSIAFVTVLSSLFLWNQAPIAVLLASFLAASVIERQYLWRSIRHMIQFSKMYNRFTKHSRYYKLGLSRFVNLKTAFWTRTGLSQRLAELENHEPTRVIFRYPELLLILVGTQLGSLEAPLVAIVVSTLIVYALTSTESFRHLGEANRYLEYNLWLLLPAFLAIEWSNGRLSVVTLAVYGGWVGLVTFRRYVLWWGLKYPERDELRDFISDVEIGSKDTIFCVPMQLASAVHARKQCRALMWQGSSWNISLYEKFIEELPYLKRDWRNLAVEYSIKWIVVENSFVTLTPGLLNWSYDFGGLSKVAETERYTAYAVPAGFDQNSRTLT